MPRKKTRTRRSFGAVRQLQSGRFQASYLGPDGARHNAPHTFDTQGDADAWLAVQRAQIVGGGWKAAPESRLTFDTFAQQWQNRMKQARRAPRTLYTYQTTIDRDLSPTFGPMMLGSITEKTVRDWWEHLPADKPSKREQAYRILRQVLADAVDRGEIAANPCTLKHTLAGSRPPEVDDLSPAEIAALAATMPTHLQLTVYLGSYCALRAGEVLGLRRRDVNLSGHALTIRQSAGATTPTAARVRVPKTATSRRTVAVPSFVVDLIREHLDDLGDTSPGAWLFPSPVNPDTPVSYTSLRSKFRTAADSAGHPDLTFHGLRHVGAVMVAQQGATLRELMTRLGHSSATVAMRYQHASQERDRALAEKLDDYAQQNLD